MNILGISACFHDSAAALLVDGALVAAAQEERFSREKHDARIPLEAVRFCLERANLTIDDVDHIVFHEKPLRAFERLLTTQLQVFPRGLGQFVQAMGAWLGGRLWLKSRLAAELGADPERLLFSEHHLSHAASAFYGSPYQRAAILTADGVGEEATVGLYLGETTAEGSRITPLGELRFPHSIGLFYSALTAYLGFRVNEGEYKVMGLASWGEPRFVAELERICTIGEDASLELDMDYFCFHRHPTKSFTPALERLLGPARAPGSPLNPGGSDRESQRFADIAASAQALTERWVLAAARHLHGLTGADNLCLAGGVALNSVANGRLAKDGPFSRVHAHPAAGDAGGALGAAWHVAHGVLGEPRRGGLEHANLGRAYSQAEVEGFLSDCRIRHRTFESEAELAAEVARRLARGEVGGHFEGGFEWGPRALGARSILADPRDAATIDRVNARVKLRERFRPFAPAVLRDEAARWFELPGERADDLLPWMLAVVPTTAEGRATLGATTHVDGTARVQTVDPAYSPRMAALLEAFKAETGVGVLLNTSMNLRDEPIASTPGEAYSVFDRSDLDFLVLERCLVEAA
ncbi:MAG: carbamoyltransferase N-terminal domain-containing protein [Myxococcota bacterium]